jgi:hypothetical protein
MTDHSYCSRCGIKLKLTYRFCPSCGSVLGQRTNLPANSDLPSSFSNDPFNLWKNSLKTSSGQNNKLFKVIAICLMIGVTLIALNSMMFSNSGVSSVELEREQAIREYERCFDRKYNEMLMISGFPGAAEMHARTWCGTPPY